MFKTRLHNPLAAGASPSRPEQALSKRWRIFWVCGGVVTVFGALIASAPDKASPKEKSTSEMLFDQCKGLTADKGLVFDTRVLITAVPPGGYGYACQSIDLICESARSRSHRSGYYDGYSVSCDDHRYVYDVENYGGKWVVFTR
jgi:hypothetical protein